MKYRNLLALFVLIQVNIVFAQNVKLKETEINIEGKISFAKPDSRLITNSANEQALMQSILYPDKQLMYQLSRTTKDSNKTHNQYIFTLQGLPIFGADYVIHSTDGTVDFANGNIPILPATIKAIPRLSTEQAQTSLKTELSVSAKISNANLFKYVTKGLVWFWKDSTLTLAYKIETEGKSILLHGNYFIDANTGKLLGFESFICTKHVNKVPPPNAPGTAQTLYSGVQNFITDANFNGGFRLREIRNNVNILTLNANNQNNKQTIVNNATDFFDNDNSWQTPEHALDLQANDVHWASEKILDYWRIIHNRNSINNNGMQIRNFIHVNDFDNLGANILMDNAFWDGTNNSMFYGDGRFLLRPVVSLDVCAHELGHGICQYTSNLTYSGESGALNEGFSDIWGATIEAWAAPAKQTWLIGEEITLVFPGYARSLSNPNVGLPNQPDTYNGLNWANTSPVALDNGGVHINSGVLNFWYFLVAQGGGGTNDIGSAYLVNSIGLDRASKIAYRTEQLLNSNANYATTRTVSIQAARDLYGIGSCEEIAVTRAWFAVGVGANYTGTIPPPVIAGVDYICSGDGTYTVPNGISVTWTVTPATGIVNRLITGNSIKLTKIGNGVVTLSALANTPCSPTLTTVRKLINVGLPVTNYKLSTIKTLTTKCGWDVILSNACNATGFLWDNASLVYSNELGQTPPYRYLVQENVDYGPLTINYNIAAVNQCGTGSFITKPISIPARWRTGDCTIPAIVAPPNGTSTNIVISPNPTFNEITVAKNDNTGFSQIKIFDKMGVLRKQFTYPKNTKKVNINVSQFPTDIYQVHVFDGTIWKNIPFSKL